MDLAGKEDTKKEVKNSQDLWRNLGEPLWVPHEAPTVPHCKRFPAGVDSSVLALSTPPNITLVYRVRVFVVY